MPSWASYPLILMSPPPPLPISHSAHSALTGLWCVRFLLWLEVMLYTALVLFIGFVFLLVFSETNTRQDPQEPSSSGEGRRGTYEGDSSSWWGGGHAEAKLKNEVPKGAVGESERRQGHPLTTCLFLHLSYVLPLPLLSYQP